MLGVSSVADNIYGQLIDETGSDQQLNKADIPKPSTRNVYADILDEEEVEIGTSVQQSMAIASKSDPDFKAKSIKLAEEMKLPLSVVERNYDLISQKKQANQVNPAKLYAQTPSLARWLSVPDNASVSKDDISSLEKIENVTKNQSYGGNLIDSVKSGFFGTAASLAK